MKRIISVLILISFSVIFPLPVAVLAFVFFATLFNRFWEGILTGLFLDTLYLSPPFFDKYSIGFFTLAFLLSFFTVEVVKKLLQTENILSKSIIFSVGLASFGLFLLIFS